MFELMINEKCTYHAFSFKTKNKQTRICVYGYGEKKCWQKKCSIHRFTVYSDVWAGIAILSVLLFHFDIVCFCIFSLIYVTSFSLSFYAFRHIRDFYTDHVRFVTQFSRIYNEPLSQLPCKTHSYTLKWNFLVWFVLSKSYFWNVPLLGTMSANALL